MVRSPERLVDGTEVQILDWLLLENISCREVRQNVLTHLSNLSLLAIGVITNGALWSAEILKIYEDNSAEATTFLMGTRIQNRDLPLVVGDLKMVYQEPSQQLWHQMWTPSVDRNVLLPSPEKNVPNSPNRIPEALVDSLREKNCYWGYFRASRCNLSFERRNRGNPVIKRADGTSSFGTRSPEFVLCDISSTGIVHHQLHK